MGSIQLMLQLKSSNTKYVSIKINYALCQWNPKAAGIGGGGGGG